MAGRPKGSSGIPRKPRSSGNPFQDILKHTASIADIANSSQNQEIGKQKLSPDVKNINRRLAAYPMFAKPMLEYLQTRIEEAKRLDILERYKVAPVAPQQAAAVQPPPIPESIPASLPVEA